MTTQPDTTTLLIEHVRARRALWDQSRQNIPGIKKVQQQKWMEVAKLHGTSAEEMKKRWQSLRGSFSKILQRTRQNAGKQSRWPYFENMLFLIKPDDVPSTLASTSKIVKTEKRKWNDDALDDASSPPAAKRQLNDHANLPSDIPFVKADANEELSVPFDENTDEPMRNDDLQDERFASNGDNIEINTFNGIENSVDGDSSNSGSYLSDGDYLFLLSFYEFLRPIPHDQKLPIRAAITNAIIEIISKGSNGSLE